MHEFFLGQMDYIFFIYGLAFVLLYAVCISLRKQDKLSIPWNYLGLFGLSHGINEWLDMVALSRGDNVQFQGVRIAIMAASFICLFAFGRLTCERLKFVRVGRWVYAPLLLAIYLGTAAGMPGVNAVVRYSFGLSGGLWAALALWRISRESREGAKAMGLAAVAMAVYAVATGFVVPAANLVTAGIINHDTFLKVAGFPVQLLRGIAACVIAIAVWQYHEKQQAGKVGRRIVQSENRSAIMVVLALGLILTCGWFWVDRAGQKEGAVQRASILNISQHVVTTIDPEMIKDLAASPEDVDRPAYQVLKSRLQHLHSAMTSVRFIYLMRMVKGKVVFLVDSEPAGSKDESPPGQVYDEASPRTYEVFVSGKGIVDDPSVDRWGTWISAYSPLNDGRTGELIAVLGVDLSAHDFNLAVALARLKGIALVGLICLFALFVFIYWRKLAFAMEQNREGKEIDLLSQWGLAAIVVLLGVTLTVALFLELRQNAWDTFQTAFIQRAIIRAQNVSQELNRQLDRLDGLRRYMDTQETVDRNAFSLYVAPLIRGVPIRALEWIPRVTHEERIFYESSARQDGVDGFRIYEKDAKGNKIPVLDRDEYFPVYFLEPFEGNAVAFGYDLSADPIRRATMEKSRDTGQPVATQPLALVQAGQKKTGVLIFIPVYAKDLPKHSLEQRRKSLKGYVLAVYNADELLKGVYSRMPPEGLACLIEDLAAPADNRVLYRHVLRVGTVEWSHPLLKYEMSLEIPDRQWRVTIVPGTAFIETNLSTAYRWILPIGLLLTGVLAAFLNFLATARYRAENLVKLRTKELNREKESLARSEERFRQLAEGTGEFIWEVDRTGLYTFASPMAQKMYGYTPEEIVGKKYFYDFFLPQDKEQLTREIFAGFDKKETFRDFLNPVVHRAGHTVLLLTNAMPILDDKGVLLGYRGVDKDITAAKNAEEALRKREAYLTSILDNFPYMAWLKDLDGRFLAVNQVYAKGFGRNVSEIIGKTDLEVSPRDLAEKYRADDIKVMREQSKVVVEEPIVSNGIIGYFETYKSPIFDNEGRVIGTTGFAHDITERKKAEQALRGSEERYRQIASAITDYIYTVFIENGKPARTNYNAACLAVTGYSADEFRADPMLWIKVVVEEDRPLVLRQIEEILTGKREVDPIEHRIIRQDGHVCWVKNTIVLHHDAHGRLVSYDGLISDISARREAEKILEDQKRALDEHAIVSKTDAQGLITYVNDKFCQISKHTRQELIGQNHNIVNSNYHPKAFFANMWSTISSGKVWQGNIRNRAKDGSFYWVQSTIVPFMDERGHVKEYISARTDITKNVENEERLEQAMQVKTNFVSTVSHELRTPLASIKSSIDILNTEAPGKLTEDQKVFLGRVKTNIDRLARLINDVLDLSKLESGKMTMNLVPLRAEEVVKDVVEMQRAVVKNRPIVLGTEFASGLPMLLADKDRLTQVLNNLINNALKFTKEGQVVVSASCDNDKKLMTFCVRDTGAGIKSEDLPKLFQKFQQVGGATQQVSGTGLGLAISKEIVERHGGRIWVESEFGKGSSFFFAIPVKHDKRILVVDDDRGTLAIIKRILVETEKYDVELADDGFVAGQKYLEFDPHLIILDIGLPKLSGLDVCTRIKQDPKTKNTKILMISSFTEETERKSREAGADDILNKPIYPEGLLSKVGDLL